MVRLYNTLKRKKEDFKPLNDNRVGLYTCGPTVYATAHIGNLRAYVFADTLVRVLEHDGYKVNQVINITDVGHLTGDRDMGEDKVETAAKNKKMTATQLAEFYEKKFKKDLIALNITAPESFPRATDHIPEMLELIKTLEKKKFTYKTSDGVYFDTSKLNDYGKLAKLDLEGLKEGARIEKNPEKKNPTDFALWKFSSVGEQRQMEWNSPWGKGFPGWHVECSAMSRKLLGQPLDIHTGGIDHIPVHHTNEIAQSETAYGKPLANYWLHSEHVIINDARVGKSEGNVVTLDDLASEGYSPLAYRYFVLQGHYRSKLNFTWDALTAAQNSLHNLYAAIREAKEPAVGCAEYEKEFFEKVNDDLNTPEALPIMWEMLKSDYPPEAKLKSLLEMDNILGLSTEKVWNELQKSLPDKIQKLVDQREKLRQQKNWAKADKLRAEIQAAGYELSDTKTGPLVLKKLS